MKEHGTFILERKGQLIIIRAFDAWNIHTSERLCIEYEKLVHSMKDKPWACFVDLRYWEYGTPDMWEPIDKTNAWANEHNQKFEAVVCKLDIQKTLMERSHEVLSNVQTAFFTTEEEALDWFRENGIEC